MQEQTAQATLAAGMTRDTVLALSERFSEPAWMRTFRQEAFAAYERLPWPVSTDEEWRRTDPSLFTLESIRPFAEASSGGLPNALQQAIDASGGRSGLLVQRNSQPVTVQLDAAIGGTGMVFTDMHTALRDHPGLVREYFMRVCVRPEESKFRALHAAFWSGGTFVYVPKGVEVTLPLLSHTWIDTEGAGVFPHTVIVAEQGSKVTVINGFGSMTQEWPAFADPVTELVLHDGAQVRYVTLQEWGRNVLEIGIIRSHLARDATLHSLLVGFGGKAVKTTVESVLEGQGATSEMLGVVFGDDRQHFDFHTLQEHRAPHTLSDLLYKNAVKDRARSIFVGMIRVLPGAQKTNAFQANRNLILSDGAKADSIPNLEIMANDLRCTHGSATSRLNEEHLFYLMSRGLPRAEAVRMVVEGFFTELFDRVPLEAVRQRLQREIEARMVE